MPQETYLGEILINGQTRKNSSVGFPIIPATIWVPPPWYPPEAQRDGSFTEKSTCSLAQARRRLDQDARAAEATGDFLGDAITVGDFDANGAPTMQLREFGADLRMVSGRIQLGPVSHALNRGGFVNIAHPGLASVADWYGDIHNHPYSGDGLPSEQDIISFNDMLTQLRGLGLPTHNRYMYIIVQNPASVSGYSTYAYNEASNFNQLGPEVNPNAQPCP